jgi:sulfoxide reductase heme-binding subunit YedZ
MSHRVEDRKQESQRFQMKVLANVAGVLPLILLIGSYVRGELGFNPIETALHRTGIYAVVFLVASLAVTPLRRLLKVPLLWYLRKPLGLYAALYAGLHFLVFIWWDYGWDLRLAWVENIDKPFILIGLVTLLILIVLSATSFKFAQKKLGKKWTLLHKTAYLAAILAVLHYLLGIKGNLLKLQGAYTLPLVMGVILLVLLALRLPRKKKKKRRS